MEDVCTRHASDEEEGDGNEERHVDASHGGALGDRGVEQVEGGGAGGDQFYRVRQAADNVSAASAAVPAGLGGHDATGGPGAGSVAADFFHSRLTGPM
jgi:hypothetical protein